MKTNYKEEFNKWVESERQFLTDLYSSISSGTYAEDLIRKIDERHKKIKERQESEAYKQEFVYNPKTQRWENDEAYKLSKDGSSYTKGKGLDEAIGSVMDEKI